MSGTLDVERFDEHPIWGACVFLRARTEDAEAVRDAYAADAASWPPLHFAVAEATPAALDPWYRLAFAQMHAYGVRASGAERADVAGITLRRGAIDDLETAIRIDLAIHEVQAASPSFSAFSPEPGGHRATWVETLEADDVAYFVAERDGAAIGHATLYADPEDTDALQLASTAVLPAARGSGVGLVLTTHALAHAAEEGYARVRTNWRVTNLVASRFWPARGFELTQIRLVRRLPDL